MTSSSSFQIVLYNFRRVLAISPRSTNNRNCFSSGVSWGSRRILLKYWPSCCCSASWRFSSTSSPMPPPIPPPPAAASITAECWCLYAKIKDTTTAWFLFRLFFGRPNICVCHHWISRVYTKCYGPGSLHFSAVPALVINSLFGSALLLDIAPLWRFTWRLVYL